MGFILGIKIDEAMPEESEGGGQEESKRQADEAARSRNKHQCDAEEAENGNDPAEGVDVAEDCEQRGLSGRIGDRGILAKAGEFHRL